MNKLKSLYLVILATVLLISANVFATSYTWNGGTSTAWGTSTNWTPNGIPGAADNVTIVTATNQPTYDGVAGVTNLTMTSGTLNLGGYTLNITGTGTFNGGTITNGKLYASGSTSVTFAGTTFSCKVQTLTSNLYLDGSVFNDSINLTKTGSSTNSGKGGNKFNGYSVITNKSTASLRLAGASPYNPDTANAQIVFNMDSTGGFSVAYNGTGHAFYDKTTFRKKTNSTSEFYIGYLGDLNFYDSVVVENTGSGRMYFGTQTGSLATLKSGGKIIIGSNGYTANDLVFKGFIQEGTTSQTFDITGTSSLIFQGSVFNGDIDVSAPNLGLNGGVFNGKCTIEKTGSNANYGIGGNVYNDTLILKNSGSGYYNTVAYAADTNNMAAYYENTGTGGMWVIWTAGSYPNYYGGDVFLRNTGNSILNFVATGTVTVNGNIYVSNSNSSRSVNIGYTSGTTALTTGHTIIEEGSTGFDQGTLLIKGMTKSGTTPISLNFGTTGEINFGSGNVINGNVTYTGEFFLNGTTFNDTVLLTHNSSASNFCTGGNVFNDPVTITNASTGSIYLANSTGDDFNGNVTFVKNSSGSIYPSYNSISRYSGNITANGSSLLHFGNGSSYCMTELDGSLAQQISGTTTEIRFKKLRMNKSANHASLAHDIVVTDSLRFNDGTIQTGTYKVILNDNTKLGTVTDTSHVDGFVKKIGNDAFTFPVGGNSNYQPISISAPSSTSDAFTAKYFKQSPEVESYNICDKAGTIDYISECDYWSLTRDAGTTNVEVTLSWDQNSCVVEGPSNSKVARWNGSQWVDQGLGATTGDQYAGTSKANGTQSSYGIFTLASTSNPIRWTYNKPIPKATVTSVNETVEDLGNLSIILSEGKAPYKIYSEHGDDEYYYLEIAQDTVLEDAFDLVELGIDEIDFCEFNKNANTLNADSLEALDFDFILKDAKGDSVDVNSRVISDLQTQVSVGLEFNNDTVLKTGAAGFENGVALAYNFIDNGEDAFIEFRPGNLTSMYGIGFFAADATTLEGDDVRYAFVISNTTILPYYDGDVQSPIGTLGINDLLRIERTGDSVFFYKNSTKLHSKYSGDQEILKTGLAFDETGAFVHDFATNTRFRQRESITNATCSAPNSGKIKLSLPNADEWNYDWTFFDTPITPAATYASPDPDGIVGWVEFTGLQPGVYQLVRYNDDVTYAPREYYLSFENEWTDIANASATGNEISKSGTVGWNSGAITMNALYSGESGWFQFQPDGEQPNYLLAGGLSSSNDDNTPQSLDYGIVVWKPYLSNPDPEYFGSIIMIMENGSIVSPEWAYHANQGSRFTVYKNGNQIYYMIDYELIHVSTVSSTIPDLYGDVAFYTPGAAIEGWASFICPSGSGFDNTCSYNSDYNTVKTTRYDFTGAVTGQSMVYIDYLGREVQAQQKSFVLGDILATQTVYDAFGRKVLQTLPAPIGSATFAYQDDFITNEDAAAYRYTDFDLSNTTDEEDGEVDNPKAVDVGSLLGEYYSNSNSAEPYVATTSYPYSRIEYTADPSGQIKRTSSPGDEYRMGNTHNNESRMFSMFTSSTELDSIFGVNASHRAEMVSSPLNPSAIMITGGNTEALKTITVDAEGKEAISYTIGGKTVATCRAGITGSECSTPLSAKSVMIYEGTKSVDIHVPHAYINKVHLPLPTYEYSASTYTVPSADMIYKITDLNTNKLLIAGTDYSINSSTRYVTFSGTYATGPLYLRISFDYTEERKGYAESLSYVLEDAKVNHKLDYSKWSIYFYDLAGNLRETVSPKDFNCEDATFDYSSTYDYSSLGQLIASSSPDEGTSERVYDSEGKLRFSQNEEQRADNKFSYINYDKHGRMMESGEYTPDAGDIFFQNYYGDYTAPGGCSGCTASSTILNSLDGLDNADCSDRSFIYYYTLNSTEDIDNTWADYATFPQKYMLGAVSKTKNEYTAAWYSYDYMGRQKFMLEDMGDDFANDIDDRLKITTYSYDADNGMLNEKMWQENTTGEFITHQYTYDDDYRLKSVSMAYGVGSPVTVAEYEYYKHGALKRTELGNIQGLDYVYTAAGQLKALNHPKLNGTDDPGKDGETGAHSAFTPDLFGYILDYHPNDYVRSSTNITSSSSTGRYDGLIEATRWKTNAISAEYIDYNGGSEVHLLNSENEVAMYKYGYNNLNELANATFGMFNCSTSVFTAGSHYKVFGSAESNTEIAYDRNGNINNLVRNGYLKTGSYEMDELAYSYTSGTNQLESVNETATNDLDYADFTASDATITYNAIGQMTQSPDEGVADIDYYPSGKVKKVTYTNDDLAEYFYNDRGIKYKTIFTLDAGGADTTWYSFDGGGSLAGIFEGDNDDAPTLTLQPVYGAGRIGMLDVVNEQVNYEITDHVGNVRATFWNDAGEAVLGSWTDYYPHGGTLPGRNFDPDEYRYNCNGQENVIGDSRWKEFPLRMFNVDLGRWMAPDPMAQYHSPYLAMGNDPVNMIDPSGGYSVPGAAGAEAGYRYYLHRIEMERQFWKHIELIGYYNSGGGPAGPGGFSAESGDGRVFDPEWGPMSLMSAQIQQNPNDFSVSSNRANFYRVGDSRIMDDQGLADFINSLNEESGNSWSNKRNESGRWESFEVDRYGQEYKTNSRDGKSSYGVVLANSGYGERWVSGYSFGAVNASLLLSNGQSNLNSLETNGQSNLNSLETNRAGSEFGSSASYWAGTLTSIYEAHLNNENKILAKSYKKSYAFRRTISRSISYNKSILRFTKVAGKGLFGVGLVLSAVDVHQNNYSANSIAWAAADTFMAGLGFVPGFQLVSGIYFTGRIAYEIYDEYSEP